VALGYDLYVEGISCIEYSQVGVEKFIKLADQLGIEWLVLSDGDGEGQKYSNFARNQLNGRKEDDHIWCLPNKNMEVLLCVSGFGDIYEENVSRQKQNSIKADKDTNDYWYQVTGALKKNVKPQCALEVAQRIVSGEAMVPDYLKNLIEKARERARSAT
jgi:putative ATP-dependent endonuclease of OLD family